MKPPFQEEKLNCRFYFQEEKPDCQFYYCEV